MNKLMVEGEVPAQCIEYNGIKIRFVKIDSEKAKEYLSLSTGNRLISSHRVRHYREMMDEGKWYPISQIILADDGSLKDGHHRLTAQASSENPSVFIEISGAKTEYLSTIDTGRPRTQTDFFKLFFESNNIKFLQKSGAIAKFLILIERGKDQCDLVDYQDCAKFLSDEREDMEKAVSIGCKIKDVGISYSTGLGAAIFKIIKRNDVRSDAFFNAILTGANLCVGNPILSLRNYLLSPKSYGGRLRYMNDYSVMSRAWNAYVNGIEVKRFKTNGSSKAVKSDMYDIKFA